MARVFKVGLSNDLVRVATRLSSEIVVFNGRPSTYLSTLAKLESWANVQREKNNSIIKMNTLIAKLLTNVL